MDSAVDAAAQKGTKLAVNYALSLCVSSQSGVRAFVPTFVMSLIAWVAPDHIQLSGTMQWLAHPAAVVVTGVLAVAECVGSMVPVVESILQAAMTFVHPVMGLLNAIGPDLGDDLTQYTQAPMAILGGSQALIFHLIKLLVRTLGLGFLGPFVAVLENVGVAVLVPLACVFGVFAMFLACCLLAVVFRYAGRKCGTAVDVLEGKELDPTQRRAVNLLKREHTLLSLIYVEEVDGFRRAPRAFLLAAALVFQLSFARLT